MDHAIGPVRTCYNLVDDFPHVFAHTSRSAGTAIVSPPIRRIAGEFPPYSYVTGRYPHPLRDPSGHGCPEPQDTALPPQTDGKRCAMFLWGCDLFDAGFYWEAHEAWEAVWHAAGRSGTDADFIKGLIKLAASAVKAREGRPEGVRRHALRAEELFRLVSRTHEVHFGLRLETLVERAQYQYQHAERLTQASQHDCQATLLPPLPP